MTPQEMKWLVTVLRYALLGYRGERDAISLSAHVLGRVHSAAILMPAMKPRLDVYLALTAQALADGESLVMWDLVRDEARALFAYETQGAESATTASRQESA